MPISINGSTGISGVNGSAAAPAIVGGDSDTGIFFGTDTASIATAGTSRLNVDSSGNIGVGTATPATQLDVRSAADNTGGYIYVSGLAGTNDASLGRFGFYNTATQTASNPLRAYITSTRQNSQWGADIQFFTSTEAAAATSKVTINEVGKVGVGTTGPASLIEVFGADTTAYSTADIPYQSDCNIWITNDDRTTASTYAGIGFQAYGSNPNTTRGSIGIIKTADTGSPGAMVFGMRGSSYGNIVERARLTSDGELLVGTTTESNLNVQVHANAMRIGSFFVGNVHDTTNSNNRTVLLHRIDSGDNHGFQFSGHFVVQSYTGNAYINVHITKKYTTDAVEVDVVSATFSAQISKTNVRVVTADYGSARYLGIQKNGGGTGTSSINAFCNGNIHSYGGIREVNNSSLGSVTEVAKLNY